VVSLTRGLGRREGHQKPWAANTLFLAGLDFGETATPSLFNSSNHLEKHGAMPAGKLPEYVDAGLGQEVILHGNS
jgi:hypothetical protein